MIEIEHLNKTYPSPTGDIHALRDVDLRIEDGEIFGIIGPNGSGKSTTAGLLSGRLKPYRGKVKTYGARVAALPQDPRELFVKDTVLDELKELDPEEALLLQITELLESLKACFRATRLIYPAASSSALHSEKCCLPRPTCCFLTSRQREWTVSLSAASASFCPVSRPRAKPYSS